MSERLKLYGFISSILTHVAHINCVSVLNIAKQDIKDIYPGSIVPGEAYGRWAV